MRARLPAVPSAKSGKKMLKVISDSVSDLDEDDAVGGRRVTPGRRADDGCERLVHHQVAVGCVREALADRIGGVLVREHREQGDFLDGGAARIRNRVRVRVRARAGVRAPRCPCPRVLVPPVSAPDPVSVPPPLAVSSEPDRWASTIVTTTTSRTTIPAVIPMITGTRCHHGTGAAGTGRGPHHPRRPGHRLRRRSPSSPARPIGAGRLPAAGVRHHAARTDVGLSQSGSPGLDDEGGRSAVSRRPPRTGSGRPSRRCRATARGGRRSSRPRLDLPAQGSPEDRARR